MDPYTFCLTLGGAGLGVMGLSGIASASHAARGHGHVGPRGGAHHRGGGARHVSRSPGAHHGPRGLASRAFGALASPRTAFSVLLGLGATGTILRGPLGGGLLLFGAALAGGVVLERLVVTPLTRFFERFASAPALGLESAIADDAKAASAFDARGHGLVAVELDGRIVQCLGTLTPDERAAGVRVRAGDRLRIEDVDAARNRCTVSTRR